MKVIDLLNKIANGEEVPLIKYRDKILHWNKEKYRFEDKDGMNKLYEIDFSELNEEVEIIEEDPTEITAEEIVQKIYELNKKCVSVKEASDNITKYSSELKENEYLERKNGEYSIHKIENTIEELEKLSEPIIEWLLKNYDPMCKIIIEDGKVEVLRSELKTLPETKLD